LELFPPQNGGPAAILDLARSIGCRGLVVFFLDLFLPVPCRGKPCPACTTTAAHRSSEYTWPPSAPLPQTSAPSTFADLSARKSLAFPFPHSGADPSRSITTLGCAFASFPRNCKNASCQDIAACPGPREKAFALPAQSRTSFRTFQFFHTQRLVLSPVAAPHQHPPRHRMQMLLSFRIVLSHGACRAPSSTPSVSSQSYIDPSLASFILAHGPQFPKLLLSQRIPRTSLESTGFGTYSSLFITPSRRLLPAPPFGRTVTGFRGIVPDHNVSKK